MASQTLEARKRAWRKKDFHLVEEDQARDHVGKLNTHKSMGPDGMHPQVLRELANVMLELLSIIFERSWRTGKVSEDWRKANVMPVFKKVKKRSWETTGQSASPPFLERNNPMHQYRLGVDLLEIGSAERELRVLVDHESAMCACGQEGQMYPGLHLRVQFEGGYSPPLLFPSEAISGVLCLVLCSPVQEGQGTTGQSPAEGYKDDQGNGERLL
ncbi:rna-directed dna polymerase from mobile element hypothetical protein [Limosa lapponica baueri]|uniref:Rna-directed dna polymerase from mobile element jockey-like n=1 Tax=Limosa lapponica baueri TaxID=1758121 RepID=A0A2I0UCU0_LIMLA|nr:rna-directed dna polymerase from mobile element hypothetical protein [Limosa lapponica baueri]